MIEGFLGCDTYNLFFSYIDVEVQFPSKLFRNDDWKIKSFLNSAKPRGSIILPSRYCDDPTGKKCLSKDCCCCHTKSKKVLIPNYSIISLLGPLAAQRLPPIAPPTKGSKGVPCRRSGDGFNGDPASLAHDNI